ncbi:MAG: pyridoxamine 5'-phosphate oxidase family protein [Candidatus Omnitrophica bacterium]|nr:pyridoxamine 5'-phosphate oxidase family protein [Candidatus Omnitrophota bacterium]MBU1923144.1 pyridoxamine 5'-phosphate oxidase family protein [Candidatus Omnitrophota bacterium]
MKQIPAAVTDFLRTQGFVVVSSIDKDGFPHSSCKDIVKVDPSGQIYLIDVYYGTTAENIKRNPQINITAVDEHKFMGYCLKGRAKVMPDDEISHEFIKSWEDNITSRLAKRLLYNLAQDKARAHHPEASLPRPKHLISIEVEEIVNLAPHYLRKEG